MTGAWLTLPAGLDGLSVWVLVIASFVASAITAAFSIGGGSLLLAVMASIVPPVALIPVHGLAQLGSNVGRAALFLGSVSWPALPAFCAGSLVGCAIGGLVVVDLPPALVQAGVGVFVIWTVFARPPRWLSGMPAVTGVVSSFLTMFFGASGLFVASYTKSLGLSRHGHVGTHAAMMTVQHAIKVVVFGLLGFAFSEWWAVVLLMVVAGGLGTWLGKRALRRMNDDGFRIALDILLVLISVRLIWSGLAAQFG